MRTNSPIYRQSIHKGSVNSIKINEEKEIVISCSASGSIIVQSLRDFKQILTINAKDMVFYVEEAFDTTVGAPQLIASNGGKPKPSYIERYNTTIELEYKKGNSFSSTYPSILIYSDFFIFSINPLFFHPVFPTIISG